jgi:hypothetical protein
MAGASAGRAPAALSARARSGGPATSTVRVPLEDGCQDGSSSRAPSGWHILLQGDCPLDISISFPVAPENYADMTPCLTAHRPFNAVPYVCEAPAGVQTAADLLRSIARLR